MRSDVHAEALAEFIRGLLRQIAELARVYDDQPLNGNEPAVYAANVMLFVPARRRSPAFPQPVLESLKFVNPGQDLTQLRGALWMRAALFATNESSSDELPDLALPVASEPKRDGRWTVLPGAPRAFVTDAVDGYVDTHTLAQYCADTGDFLVSVRQDLDRYFTEGPATAVRSFISRPLIDRGRHLGVLNIHSDGVNILGPAAERREIFQALLTPVLLDLAEAVVLYCDLDPIVKRALEPESAASA